MKGQPFDLPAILAHLGWSQGQLAERIDVHPNTVSRWVNGKAQPPALVRIHLTLLLTLKAQIEAH